MEHDWTRDSPYLDIWRCRHCGIRATKDNYPIMVHGAEGVVGPPTPTSGHRVQIHSPFRGASGMIGATGISESHTRDIDPCDLEIARATHDS